MKRSLFSALVATVPLLPPGSAFLLMNKLLAYERIDPIVQAGVVSSHVHAIIGSSAFQQTFDPNVWNNAKCSSLEVQENMSNYWMPSLVAQHDNGTFSALPLLETRVYYLLNHGPVTAFPQGFRMVAGNLTATEPDSGRIRYQCQEGNNDNNADGLETLVPYIPKQTCKYFLRAMVQFQDCWDGKHLDSVDHKRHVSYRNRSGQCPDSHPVAMPELHIEFGYRSNDYRPDQLMLSTGDKTGYGLHGDYLSFWKDDLLQKAVDDQTCHYRENVFGSGAQCQTLVSYRNEAAMQSCQLESNIPQEDVGIYNPVASLPGCNAVWVSSSGQTKLGCNPEPPTPAIGPPTESLNFNFYNNPKYTPAVEIPIYRGFNPAPSPTPTFVTSALPSPTAGASWVNLGCYTDSITSRALPNSVSVNGGMTIEGCQASCNFNGYSFAGVEYGKECWCGSGIGGGQTKASGGDCNMACAGNAAEKCGGGNRLNVYQRANSWKSLGCYTDSITSRALPSSVSVNGGMTIEGCQASCSALGYSFAGVEYGKECWCGSGIGGGQTKASDGDCNMSCSGNSAEKCGSGNRIYIYQL